VRNWGGHDDIMEVRSLRGLGEPAWVNASLNAPYRLGPNPRRALGPAAHPPHQQAGHVTAPDQCCSNVKKFLPRRRPHVTQSGHAQALPISLSDPLRCPSGQEANIRRREFITLLGGAAVTAPIAARAQQSVTPVIGFLDGRFPEAIANRLRGFHRGLKEAGYVDGENVRILYRYAENQSDRLPGLAAELARRPVPVIVASG